jgi:hypothetical protein
MASTTPVGGYAPGTNDVPGMQGGRDPATNGGHRNVAFLDAGACSKMLRSLPSMTSFFRNVRKSVSGLQTQSASNSSAIKNLLHAQANLNDQSNQLNYWMRKTSPELDKLNSELVAGNDALASLPDNSSLLDAPNVPDGITLLPGAALNNLVLYFTRPSYTGASEVAGYELVTFASASDALTMTNPTTPAGLGASALTETALTAALAAPWTTANADEFYGVYGTDLRFVSSGLVTGGAGQGLCVRLRAYNTSGANGANLYSDWSAPTLLVCAASSPTELQPVVESVTPGVAYSLVEWRAPSVRQPDGSWAAIGGLHSYTVNGTTTVVGGATTLAQVPLAGGASNVTVGACTTADGSAPVATSSPFAVVVPSAVPAPQVHVQLAPGASGAFANVACNVADYYSTTAMTYTLTLVDQTGGNTTTTVIGSSLVPGSTQDASLRTLVRVPVSGFLEPKHTYSLTATAQHASGSPSTSVSSYAVVFTTPAGSGVALTQPLANIYSSKWTNSNAVYAEQHPAGGANSCVLYKVAPSSGGTWPMTNLSAFATAAIDPHTLELNDVLSVAAWRSGSVIGVAAPDSQTVLLPFTGAGGWTLNPLGSLALSSSVGGTVATALAFPGYTGGASANQGLCVVVDPTGASTQVLAPTVAGYDFNGGANSYFKIVWGGDDATMQYLAATTTDGEVHVWPYNPTTRTFSTATRLASGTGFSGTATYRVAMNAVGDTLVLYGRSSLHAIYRSGATWTYDAANSRTGDLDVATDLTRPIQLSRDGTRMLTMDYWWSSGIQPSTVSRLWKRSALGPGVWGNVVDQIAQANTSATTNSDTSTAVLLPDGGAYVVYDVTSNTVNSGGLLS